MQSLSTALIESIAPASILRAEVQHISRDASSWHVHLPGRSLQADQIVLACPASTAASFLANDFAPLAVELASIPYSSAVLVNFVFDAALFAHRLDGFGFLVPRRERATIAAATWINTKFPSRVPGGRVALRAFLVDPEATRLATAPDNEIAGRALSDLQRLMRTSCQPLATLVHRWPNSMPQYVVGHAARLARIEAARASLPGLYLVSNYLDGIGIPDCIRLARSTAETILCAAPDKKL